MIKDVIIPNVEFSIDEIPSKAFFRNTQKISLKISEMGITMKGSSIAWNDIHSVDLKFFNSNPYIQLTTSESKFSFFFENKFYYRRKAPWFGASEFITREFVKILEEKNLYSIQKLDSNLLSNESHGAFIHSFWNFFFIVFPVLLLVLAIVILLGGLFFGPQTQFL